VAPAIHAATRNHRSKLVSCRSRLSFPHVLSRTSAAGSPPSGSRSGQELRRSAAQTRLPALPSRHGASTELRPLPRCRLGHHHRLRALRATALAGEVNRGLGFGQNVVRGDLGHALVDLSEERLVPGQPSSRAPTRWALSGYVSLLARLSVRQKAADRFAMRRRVGHNVGKGAVRHAPGASCERGATGS
jgi:hypothetical protein